MCVLGGERERERDLSLENLGGGKLDLVIGKE